MLLAIDIGNTNISFGVFRGDKIVKRFAIPTRNYSRQRLKKNLRGINLDNVIICSVVPRAIRILLKDIKKFTGISPKVVGRDIKIPIENRYRNPKQVGQDRLVGAFVASKFYGAPLIIIDIGTAITLDVVSKNKEYLGGIILPGLDISLDVLHQRTALLPKVRLARPKELIGRDTSSSILSGLMHGFGALVDGLALRLKKSLGRRTKVVATGGGLKYVKPFSKQIQISDPELILKGLKSLIFP